MATAYQETGRFRPDVRSFVDRELRHGINSDSYGYHGTSVYTLLHMLHTGVLPGKSTPDNPELYGHPKRGDVYFWKREQDDYLGHEAIGRAESYAKNIARKHHFIESLRLSYHNPDHHYAALELANRLCDETERNLLVHQLSALGPSEAQIMMVVGEAQEMEGVLMGLSPLLEKSYQVIDCNHADDGWKVETGAGLPFQFIQGFQFLSPRDEQLYHQLSKR